MSTILIADDEARIRRLVSDFLKRDGHTIMEAGDGREALNLLENRRAGIDLAILDVMMPGMDGFSVLHELRRQEEENTHLPVMMLTARAEDADQVRGLEDGADDYVTKPFSPVVLAARVRALLKREGRGAAPVAELGALSINELRREVRVNGAAVELTPKEYELLIYFKNNRAIALSRESILNAVWGYDYFGDLRTVDTHVKKLRAKLGDCGAMIETVRGYGYRLEA
ncbi:response regulator transcription factor [Agathobaculum sp. NTUH-O15-33]|uniref:response regulator transcription factor n=1 Tax=Agathobaculum sp. NTUH-O15-33 TaxID=3079302 RepID=UPI0029585024|nr:response regulator transcription factor [Agathobaculum sp. NTUH-O15-33]WNX84223.1 response regulator transcription factor [Agathobaculum sp. NTUH-O15-33]